MALDMEDFVGGGADPSRHHLNLLSSALTNMVSRVLFTLIGLVVGHLVVTAR